MLHPEIFTLAKSRWPQVSRDTGILRLYSRKELDFYVVPIYTPDPRPIWERWVSPHSETCYRTDQEKIPLEAAKLPELKVAALGYGPRTDTLVIQLSELGPDVCK